MTVIWIYLCFWLLLFCKKKKKPQKNNANKCENKCFFMEDFSSQSGAEYKFKYIYLESHYFVMLSETLFLGQSFFVFLNPYPLSWLIFSGKCLHGHTERSWRSTGSKIFLKVNLGQRHLAHGSVLPKQPCPPRLPQSIQVKQIRGEWWYLWFSVCADTAHNVICLFRKRASDCLQGIRCHSVLAPCLLSSTCQERDPLSLG